MPRLPFGESERLRVLECWLPLAEAVNLEQDWGYDLTSLEELILAAAPALGDVCAASEARATLCHYHEQLGST